MREPTWGEVDGVLVAWLDLPGPLSASLCFRAGIANETAPQHGVTHLVEHLALYGMHDRPYSLNGSVDLAMTTFMASGRPEEMAEFLATVCGRLGDLPVERVEVERGILRAESASRSVSYREGLLYWRYGAQAHGLVGVAEYGLNWLDADTVRWWAAQRFTRQNALLLLTGPPPAGLRLPLPDGAAQPPVVARPIEEGLPGWTAVPAAGLAMGGTAPRSAGSSAALSTLDHELTRVLRFERGITYSVASNYEAVDAETAHVIFSADAATERHGELRDTFLGIVDRLAADGPPAAVMERLRDSRDRAEPDDLARGFLAATARDFALGRPYEPFSSIAERMWAVTGADVQESLRALAGSAIYLVPEPLELPPRYRVLAPYSAGAVEGRSHRGRAGGTLVVGPQGVSLVSDGNPVTVRWEDAVATLWWADGARVVLGRDGFRVGVVPADWKDGAAAVARVDEFAPRHTRVPMQGAGPRPLPSGERPKRPLNPVVAWIGNGALYLFVLMMAIGALEGPQPATATSPGTSAGDVAFMAVVAVVLLVANVWWTVVLRRRRAATG